MEKKFIVIDIDGTLSKVGSRVEELEKEPKNWTGFFERCGEDEVVEPILELTIALANFYIPVICTDRPETVREQTAKWIMEEALGKAYNLKWEDQKDSFKHEYLLMRKEFSKSNKVELLAAAGYTPENVTYVLEDNPKIVSEMREAGFTVLQVADGPK